MSLLKSIATFRRLDSDQPDHRFFPRYNFGKLSWCRNDFRRFLSHLSCRTCFAVCFAEGAFTSAFVPIFLINWWETDVKKR